MVELIDQAVEIAQDAQSKSKKLKDFHELIRTDPEINSKCDTLRQEVNDFAKSFPMPGHDSHWDYGHGNNVSKSCQEKIDFVAE